MASTMFMLADRALDGRLPDLLRTWHRAGVSRRAAAVMLTDELGGIEINSMTVLRWTREVVG